MKSDSDKNNNDNNEENCDIDKHGGNDSDGFLCSQQVLVRSLKHERQHG